ncbi:MAG TPA: mechanosensitive ion channel [Saprospiraceae bacterium]|jgi:preprotein translocase subunit YajC|nr:mechanosensitive ion channel [Saprospiraceae bacterium]HRO08974.1 mechanosensitive ion channel [Saprospiraceae bacterium]HRP42162.1 mechanosensitive ion channel [Saprospiraceae bacterium]
MIPLIFSQDIQQALSDMLMGFFSAVPKLILAFIILITGIVISGLSSKLVEKTLNRFNLERYTDKLNQIDFIYKNNIRIRIEKIAGKTVKYLILLVFIMTAVGVLDMPVLAELIQDIIKWIPNLIAAFIMLTGGLLLAVSLQNVVTSACKSLGMPSANIIGSLLFYFILINVIIVALAQAQINTTFFAQNISIIIAGVVLAFSIGYGFASKDLVASFLASYYTKDKLKVGDKVRLNGVEGIIKEVDKSSVTLRTDEKEIIIPLNKVLLDNIEIYRK